MSLMPSERMRNAGLIFTSAGCVVLLSLLIFRSNAPPPAHQSAGPKEERSLPAQRLEPSTLPPSPGSPVDRSEETKLVQTERPENDQNVTLSLEDQLRGIREAAKHHEDIVIVRDEMKALRLKYEDNLLLELRIFSREADIYRDILQNRKSQIDTLEAAKIRLDSAQAEHALLSMRVLVDLGEAYSSTHDNTEAVKNYKDALDLPYSGKPYDRNIKDHAPLYHKAARGAVSLMPKHQLVSLNLHPMACIRLWDESPDLKPFLQPMSRVIAVYKSNVKTWLLEKRKEHKTDPEMTNHLKAVLELLL